MWRLCFLGGVLLLSAGAQRRYVDNNSTAVRRSSNWDANRRDGQCTIRVRIDGEADVELRGDRVMIHIVSGGPGRDEGSECNAPVPSGGISNFRFQGVDGRGEVRLSQEPRKQNRWVALVTIRDTESGDEGYTFRLSWNWDGSSSGGSGGGGFWSGGGSSGGNNAVNQRAISSCNNAIRDKLVSQYGGYLTPQGNADTWAAGGQGNIGVKGRARYTDGSGRSGDIEYECRFEPANGRISDANYSIPGNSWQPRAKPR